jgi:hypothetical protein
MAKFSERIQGNTGKEIAIRTTETLTPPQVSQVEASVKAYLRLYNLEASYQNMLMVRDVVRECMYDGLGPKREDLKIRPDDNLKAAYDYGVQIRNGQVTAVKTESDLVLKDKAGLSERYIGDLALPGYQLDGARREMAVLHKTPAIPNISALNREVQNGREVYGLMKPILRTEIKKRYPHVTEVDLSREQQAGFLRNMIFQWMTKADINIDLEVVDLIAHKDAFNDALKRKWLPQLRAFAETVGVAPTDEHVRVFHLLGEQVSDALEGIDIKPQDVRNLKVISDANKQLDGYFMLTNPFYRLRQLSEDEGDRGYSIWDPERTQVIELEGKRYLIPSPETVQYLSFQYQSTDPDRSNVVAYTGTKLAELATHTFNEGAAKEQEDLTKLEQVRGDIRQLHQVVRGAPVPAILRMGNAQISEQYEKQQEVFQSERGLYRGIEEARAQVSGLVKTLENKYRDGSEFDPADFEHFETLEQMPQWVSRRVADFLRFRVRNRFFTVGKAIHHYNLEFRDQSVPGHDQISSTTFLDLLQMRTRLWIHDFRSFREGVPSLTPEMAELLAVRDETELNKTLSRQASKLATFHTDATPYPNDPERARDWILKEKRDWVLAQHPQYRIEDMQIQDLKLRSEGESMSVGVTRDESASWRDLRDQTLDLAVTNLMPEWKIDQYDVREPNVPYTKRDQDPGKSSREIYLAGLRKKVGSADGRMSVMVRGLLRTLPGDIFTPVRLSMEEFNSNLTRMEGLPEYWKFSPDKRDKQQGSAQIEAMIRDYLKDIFPDRSVKELDRIVVPEQVQLVKRVGLNYTIFKGIEDDMMAWQDAQLARLGVQMDQTAGLLGRHPVSHFNQLVRRREELVDSVRSIRVGRAKKIARAIEPIVKAGLIKELPN